MVDVTREEFEALMLRVTVQDQVQAQWAGATATIAERLAAIEARLEGLEERVDERLGQTERVLVGLSREQDRLATELRQARQQLTGFELDVQRRLDSIQGRTTAVEEVSLSMLEEIRANHAALMSLLLQVIPTR